MTRPSPSCTICVCAYDCTSGFDPFCVLIVVTEYGVVDASAGY